MEVKKKTQKLHWGQRTIHKWPVAWVYTVAVTHTTKVCTHINTLGNTHTRETLEYHITHALTQWHMQMHHDTRTHTHSDTHTLYLHVLYFTVIHWTNALLHTHTHTQTFLAFFPSLEPYMYSLGYIIIIILIFLNPQRRSWNTVSFFFCSSHWNPQHKATQARMP